MAVAMLWMVTLGGEQEVSDDELLISDRPPRSQPSSAGSLSCFVNGLLTIKCATTHWTVSFLRSLVSFTF